MACRYQAPASIVRLILETSANEAVHSSHQDFVDAVYSGHRTALFEAAWYGRGEAAKALLEHGATLKPDSRGTTPLHLACHKNHLAVLGLFLNLPKAQRDSSGITAALNMPNQWNHTPLWDAVHKNHVEAVALLTAEGTSKHYVASKNEGYPLHYAVDKNYADIISIFLKMSTEQAQQADFSVTVTPNGANVYRIAAALTN